MKKEQIPAYDVPATLEECHERIVQLMQDEAYRREDRWNEADSWRDGWSKGYTAGRDVGRLDGKWEFLGKVFRLLDEPDLADYCERSTD